ncbi:YejG-like protein [Serratia fonticola]|uniref:YejG-like protein n=1 Tax=Serratia fonticola TaxID=47917 RepID=A0A542D0Q6_SERFO|nr:YejG family protein [Serratia fonticola]TQI81318.1 YejG-like protein [Serratia fonticola]TQI96658.1 YejG-like protein [Serratia fonticola]TVZ71155.1 YejG-like protein [Serratia fonticola]
MDSIQLSVVHRLPQSYRWLSGFTGSKVEPIPLSGIDEGNNLIGLKLLSHDGGDAWRVMQQLNLSLQEIQVDCAVVEWEGEPCLFVHHCDESAAMCRLKNVGAAIAEQLSAQYPF